jgi:hypothetical protein
MQKQFVVASGVYLVLSKAFPAHETMLDAPITGFEDFAGSEVDAEAPELKLPEKGAAGVDVKEVQ